MSTARSEQTNGKEMKPESDAPEDLIGYVDVHVHRARDIHNICIYHKQDVYAKLSFPGAAAAASTRIVHGGGRDPVFDESLRLSVRAADVDASLRCEVWMLSRVKNYLQDQLLGFALVPLPDVVAAEGGTLSEEFAMSSTDLFNTPAGFVLLSLSYIGAVPEVMPVSPHPKVVLGGEMEGEEIGSAGGSVTKEYEKIEFPDLNLVTENQLMVSEYFGIPTGEVAAQRPESHGVTANHDAGVRVVESFLTENSADLTGAYRSDTPPSSEFTTDSSVAAPVTPQSSSEPSADAVASQEEKEKSSEVVKAEADSFEAAGNELSENTEIRPVIGINIEPVEMVDKKEIMDMYTKSMQQFTESLAKMKLPVDMENCIANGAEDANVDSAKKTPGSQEKGSKVFYGSRAFF